RDYRDALPRRLAFSLDPRRFPRLGLGIAEHLHLFLQGRPAAFLFYLGALDLAALPLRPIDAARLGFLFRDRAGEHFCHGVSPRLLPDEMTNSRMTNDEGSPNDEVRVRLRHS